MNSGFFVIDHTADAAIKAWGEDFEGLLRSAAEGMYSIMDVSCEGKTAEKLILEIRGEDRESLLVGFLAELLFLLENKGLVFYNFDFAMTGIGLTVTALEGCYSRYRREIKAVTYHELKIIRGVGRLEAVIVFDL